MNYTNFYENTGFDLAPILSTLLPLSKITLSEPDELIDVLSKEVSSLDALHLPLLDLASETTSLFTSSPEPLFFLSSFFKPLLKSLNFLLNLM